MHGQAIKKVVSRRPLGRHRYDVVCFEWDSEFQGVILQALPPLRVYEARQERYAVGHASEDLARGALCALRFDAQSSNDLSLKVYCECSQCIAEANTDERY